MKICIVSHFAYGAFSGGWGGGVERQTSRLSRWLAARGHDVTLVTWDEGQAQGICIDGVRIVKVCRLEDGIPGLRFLYPRWTSLVRALGMADADLYYHNCAEYVTGQVALWCRGRGRRFVYSVASDPDCDPRLPVMKTLRERILYRYGLRRADRIIVQTRIQQAMLRDGFGLASEVLPMPYAGPASLPGPGAKKELRVLWVGRFAPEKRLDRLLDIAEALPHVAFDVAGGPNRGRTSYTDDLEARARRLANVRLHGIVPHDRMGELYSRASVLCSTSEYEGFPNTFIEAWSHGVPVLSLVDPDGNISAYELGHVARGTQGLKQAMERIAGNPDELVRLSARARDFFLDYHQEGIAMARFEKLFLDLAIRG